MKQNIFFTLISIAVFVAGGVGAYTLLDMSAENEPATSSVASTENDSVPIEAEENEACSLIGKEVIASILGGTFKDGKPGYASDLPQRIVNPTQRNEELKNWSCLFEQENDGTPASETATLGLSVTVNNFANSSDAKKYMDGFVETQEKGGGGVTMVDGLGDQSFFPTSASGEEAIDGMEMLYVRVDRKVYVFVEGSEDPLDRQTLRHHLTQLVSKI